MIRYDPTLVDLTRNFFVICMKERVEANIITKMINISNADPDQTAPEGGV